MINFTDEFKEGVASFVKGENQKKNPFNRESDEWNDWCAGWQQARAIEFYLRLKA